MTLKRYIPGAVLLMLFWTITISAQGIEELPNPIQEENARPGTRDWQIPAKRMAYDRQIEGYVSAASVNLGEGITFYVSIKNLATHYDIRIYRLGWYGGDGGRLIAEKLNRVGTTQAMPDANHTTGLAECSWILPAGFAQNTWIASGAPSGYYLAKITTINAVDNPNPPPGQPLTYRQFESYIPFVVREDARASDFLFQSSMATWQAYNYWPADYGDNDWKSGKSLYPGKGNDLLSFGPPVPENHPLREKQARKVSFNRPYYPNGIYGTAGKLFLLGEYNMARWMEHQGYDVTYTTDVDTDAASDLVNGPLRPGHHKVFLSVGHNEYWSWQMRDNIERARNRSDQPLNIGWFGGNDVHWQIRFENSSSPNSSPSNVPRRTVVAYKHLATNGDPLIRDPIFVPPSEGGSVNNYLTTTLWRKNKDSGTLGSICPQGVNCFKDPEDELVGVMTDLINPSGRGDFELDANYPSWVRAGIGATCDIPPVTGLVGYEADTYYDSHIYSTRPPATVIGTSDFYGDGGRTTANAVFYMMPGTNGARVFAAGTVEWGLGIDPFGGDATWGPVLHGNYFDPRVETMTRNVLACLRDGTGCS